MDDNRGRGQLKGARQGHGGGAAAPPSCPPLAPPIGGTSIGRHCSSADSVTEMCDSGCSNLTNQIAGQGPAGESIGGQGRGLQVMDLYTKFLAVVYSTLLRPRI